MSGVHGSSSAALADFFTSSSLLTILTIISDKLPDLPVSLSIYLLLRDGFRQTRFVPLILRARTAAGIADAMATDQEQSLKALGDSYRAVAPLSLLTMRLDTFTGSKSFKMMFVRQLRSSSFQRASGVPMRPPLSPLSARIIP